MADKDWWDKAEIVGKVGGAIVIPIVVGVAAAVLNSQISDREQAARMSEIALGILTEQPAEPGGPNALREWAIGVLLNPSAPPTLSEEAADTLRLEALPTQRTVSFSTGESEDECAENVRLALSSDGAGAETLAANLISAICRRSLRPSEVSIEFNLERLGPVLNRLRRGGANQEE